MDFNGVLNLIIESKEDKYVFLELVYEWWNQLWILQKKILGLVSVIALIVFNGSFGVKNDN